MTPESDAPPGYDADDVAPRPIPDAKLPIYSVALDVSGQCNLACGYCAEAASQPARPPMTPSVLDSALRFLARDKIAGVRPSIRIGSGEPLLSLPLLKKLNRLLGNSDTSIDVFLTTNGTLIDEKTADWLANTGWHIKISLDGYQAAHDRWRCDRQGRPTHKRAAQAVAYLTARCPERTSVAAVLCHGTDPREVFGAIANLGIRRIELLPVASIPVGDEGDPRPRAVDVENYLTFIETYARSLIEGNPDKIPTLVRFEECLHRLMGYGNTLLVCGAGRSFICAGPDGVLYPCFRFAGVEGYILGDCSSGIDVQAQENFLKHAGRPAAQRPGCRSCWATPVCGGPCFSVAEFFGPGDGAPDEVHCAYKLADVRSAFRVVEHLRKQDSEKLLKFLPIDLDAV